MILPLTPLLLTIPHHLTPISTLHFHHYPVHHHSHSLLGSSHFAPPSAWHYLKVYPNSQLLRKVEWNLRDLPTQLVRL